MEPHPNRAFSEMHRAAAHRLAQRRPAEVARCAGVLWDEAAQVFRLDTLGRPVAVRYPQGDAAPPLDGWHHLILLHYLALADGAPRTGQLLPMGRLPGGMVRGGGFDRQFEQAARRLAACRPEALFEACAALGGERIAANADVCCVFPFLPRYPMTLKLWFPDDELPGSGRLFLDGSAAHYLSVEDAVTAGGLLQEALLAACL